MLLFECGCLAACGSTGPVEPTVPTRPSVPVVAITCVDDTIIRCSARFQGEDVTTQARWSAADAFRLAMDVPVTASTAVEFPSPGMPRAVRRGNVYIRADYTPSTGYATHSIAPHAYAFDPSRPPERLAYLSGFTFINTVGGTLLGGVDIDIVEGERAGTHVVSLDANGSYMIEFLHLNSPFTARASKLGYESAVKTHPGIADDTSGYPSNNFLHFALAPR